MAEEFKVTVGTSLNTNELDNFEKRVNALDGKDIALNVRLVDADGSIKNFERQVNKALGGKNGMKANVDLGVSNNSANKVQSQINKMVKDVKGLDFDVDINTVQTKKELDELERQLYSTFKDIEKLEMSPFNEQQLKQAEKRLETLSARWKNNIKNMPDLFASDSEDDDAIEKAYAKAEEHSRKMMLNLEKAQATLDMANAKMVDKGNANTVVEARKAEAEAARQAAQEERELNRARQEASRINDKAEKIKMDVETGVAEKKVQQLYTKIERLGSGADDDLNRLKVDLGTAEASLKAAIAEGNPEKIINAWEEFNHVLTKTANAADAAKSKMDFDKLNSDLERSKRNATATIELWRKSHSAAESMFGQDMDAFISRIQNASTREEVQAASKDFGVMTKQAKLAGVAQLNMFDGLKKKVKEYTEYLTVATVAMAGFQIARDMARNVLEVDTAMTGLYRVTDLTSEQYSQLYDNMTDSAREYGATLTDIINATADWTRAGFDANTANELAEITTMYQHIADLDYATASENLLTAYNGFKDEFTNDLGWDVTQSVGYIIDVLNELDNKYSVTAAGIGEALQRNASAMDLAGNTFQETAAMITGMTEVIQDPEKSGQALKILSLRLRGMKGELQALGEEVDPTVENISKMQGQILNLTHGKVNIFDDKGQFKSTYEIMDGIAAVWKEMNSIEQADLLETIAGKNRANEVAALISNWGNVETAVVDATNAEGSAARENEKYMEHLQSALDRFQAAWQELSVTTLNSGFLTNIVDFGTDALNVINDLIEQFGVLKPLIASLFAGAGLLGKGVFKTGNKENSILGNILFGGSSLSDLAGAFKEGKTNGGNGIQSTLNGISSAWAEFNGVLSRTDKNAINNLREMLKPENRGRYSTQQLMAAFDGTSDALSDLRTRASEGRLSLDDLAESSGRTRTSMMATRAATLALNVGLGMLAGVVISELIKAYDEWAHAQENASKTADDLFSDASANATQAAESYSSLNDLIAQYQSLASQNTSDPEVRLQIADVQSQINDLIGEEASGIDLVNGSLNTQLELLQQIQTQQAKKSADAAKDAYNAAKAAEDATYGQETWSVIPFLAEYNYDSVSNMDWDLYKALQNNSTLKKYFASENMTAEDAFNTLLGRNPIKYETSVNPFSTNKLTVDLSSLETTQEKLEAISAMMDTIESKYPNDYATNDMYKDLLKAQSYYQEYLDASSAAARQMLQYQTEAVSAENDLSNMANVNAGSFEEARNTMLDSMLKNSEIADAIKQGYLNENDVTQYVNTYLGTLDNLSAGYEEWTNNIQSFQDIMAVNGISDISGIGLDNKEIASIDSYIEKINTLREAYDKFQDGDLSSDEIDKLLKDFPELSKIMEEAGYGADDLDDAIRLMLNNLNTDMVDEFNTSIGDITKMSDEAASSATILGNALEQLGPVGKAMSFSLNIEEETESINQLNEALAQSKSITGLTEEQISNVSKLFQNLSGYDTAKLFEETAHGIRLNTQEFNRLQNAYAEDKSKEIEENLNSLNDEYTRLTNEMNNPDNIADYTELYNQSEEIRNQINLLAQQAAMYDGLTSSYKQWQDAQSAGNDRDMYESILSGMDEVEDEIGRGWWDDSTVEYLELLTGRDLSTANIDQIKDAYESLDKTVGNTSYTIRDFFTQNEEGASDSNGVYNFLEAAESLEGQLGYDFVQRDENGNIIGFDISVDGRKALAETMGISEELVDIIIRASEDAGFVVNMDGTYTQLADLKSAAQEAADYLKNEAHKTDYTFNLGVENVDGEGGLNEQLQEANKILDEFRNEDGTINLDADGAEEALTLVRTLQTSIDSLEHTHYVNIDTSSLDDELQEPIEKIGEFEKLLRDSHQYEIIGDTENLEKTQEQMDAIIDDLYNLDPEIKASLDIDGMSKEEIEQAITDGTIEIPAQIDFVANIDKSLQLLLDGLLVQQGLLDEEVYHAEVEVYADAKVQEFNTQQAQEEINNGIDEIVKNNGLSQEQVEIAAEIVGNIDVGKLQDVFAGLDDKTVTVIAEAIGTGDVETLQSTLDGLDDKTVQAIAEALGYDNVEELKASLGSLDSKTVQAIAEALGINDVTDLRGSIDSLDSKTVQAVAEALGQSDVSSLKSSIDAIPTYKRSVVDVVTNKFTNVISTIKGAFGQGANGTAHVNGTAFADGTEKKTFKQGNWSTKDSGTALVGELGQETVVRNGRFFTIGDNGAEFFNYKKGDIIFNHRQTEELFKNGYVTSNGGRGRAFAEGTAFSTGTGGAGRPGSGGRPMGGNSSSSGKGSSSSKKKSSSNKSSTKQATEDAKEFEETIDWIEVIIDRIERAIDSLDRTASSTFKTWTDRTKALNDQITKTRQEIDLQNQAYNRYLQQASQVGLSSDWVSKVQNGKVDIETIRDEDLKDKIDKYTEWYNKALDCKDAIDELRESESELYNQRFENVSTKYEGILGGFQHEADMLNEGISMSEAKGWVTSTKYYEELIKNQQSQTEQLKKQRQEMLNEMKAGIESGAIKKGSETWLSNSHTI